MDSDRNDFEPFFHRDVSAEDRRLVIETVARTVVPGADHRLDAILDAMRRHDADLHVDPGRVAVRFPAALRCGSRPR